MGTARSFIHPRPAPSPRARFGKSVAITCTNRQAVAGGNPGRRDDRPPSINAAVGHVKRRERGTVALDGDPYRAEP